MMSLFDLVDGNLKTDTAVSDDGNSAEPLEPPNKPVHNSADEDEDDFETIEDINKLITLKALNMTSKLNLYNFNGIDHKGADKDIVDSIGNEGAREAENGDNIMEIHADLKGVPESKLKKHTLAKMLLVQEQILSEKKGHAFMTKNVNLQNKRIYIADGLDINDEIAREDKLAVLDSICEAFPEKCEPRQTTDKDKDNALRSSDLIGMGQARL